MGTAVADPSGAPRVATAEQVDSILDSIPLALLLADEAVQAPAREAERLRVLSDLAAERRASGELAARVRHQTHERIAEALVDLRSRTSSGALIAAAPRALCRACGFRRAMVSRIAESMWMPEAVELVDQPADGAEALRSFVATVEAIPLAPGLLEEEMVRREAAIIVTDAMHDPGTHVPFQAVAGSTSYVAAPVLHAGHVVMLLHADRHGDDQPVSLHDRSAIRLFADGFGLLFERAVLAERLQRRDLQLRASLAQAVAALDRLRDADLALDARPHERAGASGSWHAPAPPVIERILTPREREVLALIASGATNRTVATALVLSQETVKTHVRSILRKLSVTTRTGAVIRYLEMTARDRDLAL